MLKLTLSMGRLVAVLGVLATLPGVSTQISQQLQDANQLSAAVETEQIEKLLSGAADQSHQGDSGSEPQVGFAAALAKLMSASGSSDSRAERVAQPRTGPLTVIYHAGQSPSNGKEPDATVLELPPNGNATIIDGRLQVYRPSRHSPAKGSR